MSVAELKRQARKLGPTDTLHLAAYLKHLARRKDPAYLAGLDATWNAMAAGDKLSLARFKRINVQLRKSGV
jgi:hypothetical protein